MRAFLYEGHAITTVNSGLFWTLTSAWPEVLRRARHFGGYRLLKEPAILWGTVISRLVNDVGLRKKRGAAARAEVLRNHSIEALTPACRVLVARLVRRMGGTLQREEGCSN